jgi:hypothetical protein
MISTKPEAVLHDFRFGQTPFGLVAAGGQWRTRGLPERAVHVPAAVFSPGFFRILARLLHLERLVQVCVEVWIAAHPYPEPNQSILVADTGSFFAINLSLPPPGMVRGMPAASSFRGRQRPASFSASRRA